MISFPYYAKYVFEKDLGSAFWHIDLNIEQFFTTNCGANAIQGSVSLDKETAEAGCTELVKGFHNHIRPWWNEVKQCAAASRTILRLSGLVQNVKALYTKADADKYGPWTPVPCPKWGV